jgi:hypothetical protein
LRPPPDKSISHRAALIGAMGEGATAIEGYLEAGRAERHYWRDLWAYRELFAILACHAPANLPASNLFDMHGPAP